jgi:hypothetical protein
MAYMRTADPPPDAIATLRLDESGAVHDIRRFQLRVVEGPARDATYESLGARCSIGSHESNDLALRDPTVSRFHCVISAAATARLWTGCTSMTPRCGAAA